MSALIGVLMFLAYLGAFATAGFKLYTDSLFYVRNPEAPTSEQTYFAGAVWLFLLLAGPSAVDLCIAAAHA